MAWPKALIEKLVVTSPEKLLDATAPYEVVSFDVFDTLVKRNVRKPEDLFELLERKLVLAYGDSMRGFAARRIWAESELRTRNGTMEVTLDEIYSSIGLSSDIETAAKEFEQELEFMLCVPNKPVVDFLRACIARGQRVIIITDIYLPRHLIKRILDKCEIVCYECLFVSSEIRLTKRSGELFRAAFSETGARPEVVAHIGDSLVSDYWNARKAGAAAFLIDSGMSKPDSFAVHLSRRASTDAGIVSSLLFNAPAEVDSYRRFGYECFGPYLLGFSKWLATSLEKEGLEKVYFLSRDGYILKMAFETLGITGFDCEYLEVSRRSLRIPMLRDLGSIDEIIDVMPPSKVVSIEGIFDTLGLKTEGHEELLCSLGLGVEQLIEHEDLPDDDRVIKLVDCLRPEFCANSEEQFLALRDYLESIGVGGRFAIVDIGWSGGMQRYLSNALSRMGIDCDIVGYYTGIVAYAKRNVKYAPLKLNGYVFDCLRDGAAADIRRFYVGFLETLFLEQRGTVIGYGHDGQGRPVALRAPYEYATEDGLLSQAEHVKELQEGAIAFLCDAVSSGVASVVQLEPGEAFDGIDAAGADPSKRILDMFADFNFFDDGAVGKLAAPSGVLGYLTHPQLLKADLLRSRWKTAFAKRLFHGLPLPYRGILSWLARGDE